MGKCQGREVKRRGQKGRYAVYVAEDRGAALEEENEQARGFITRACRRFYWTSGLPKGRASLPKVALRISAKET